MALPFSRPRPIDIIAWVLLAVAVIFAVFVRVRLRELPLERDEGEFAYAGQLLLDGIPPYKLAYNMKLPGTYIAYAALMAVFGQTIAGIHLGLLAVNVATILLLYRLTRELFDPISAGLAAVFYAIMSSVPACSAWPRTPRISSLFSDWRASICFGGICSRADGGRSWPAVCSSARRF